ncbi:hypothetical protein Ae201684P_018666 [Aphanomyces euteiches]|uniref:Uncharacterized protein n=1 Tax=Aphanomyces euteiches TaxID=100861 RepID=A0A6G0XWN9_9STRA|nr:hypothetical protein Ae201684_000723 [Aphanomyces euteiches]KAH9099653.1 hypothetical protein Ae201684P_018666 [Aphanomyces euteiches]
MHPSRKQVKPKPVSALGDSSFNLTATHQTPASEDDKFDIKEFLLEQRATQSFHDSALFRSEPRDLLSTATDSPFGRGLKKKQLPRMDMASRTQFDHSGNQKKAQAEIPHEDGGYRLYSIEVMAECSLHASRSHNHTWQTLRTSDLRSDFPCKRSDVVDLEACFDAAMSYSGGKDNWEGDRKTALIDRDYMAVQANVVALYRPSTDVDRRLLTSIVFEQKWSDLVLGELEAMLMVSFFEQGNLIRKVRIQYATAFYHLEAHYTACEAEKQRALDVASQSQQALHTQAAKHDEAIAVVRRASDQAIARLKDEMDHERAEADRKMFEAKEQIAKMGETMKTLNAIFKQMREDSDKVRAVELREANQKLERQVAALEEEVRHLRPLIAQNRSLQVLLDTQTANMEATAKDVRELAESVEEKDKIIENLLHRQEQLLAKMDLQTEKAKPGTQTEPDATEDAPSTLCSRCQMSLMDDGIGAGGLNGDDTAASEDSKTTQGQATQSTPMARRRDGKRVHCLSYRILLPNLQGRRPTKDTSWTLGCIRSILFAKSVDDNICFHMGQPLRLRMSEFVYAWFAPPDSEIGVDALPDQRDQSYALADEARWCLYYGAKLLSRDYIEAKLFLSFLDEKHGDDELVFALFCLRVLDCLVGSELDWSALRHSMTYTAFREEWEAHLKITGETIQVQPIVWISLHHASLATAIVLSKATADERDAFDAKLKTLAVTSLPAGDRPSKYLTFDGKNDGPMVDAYQWLHLMLQEYQEEQAQRRAAIRLMFQTASATPSTTYDDATSASTTAEMDMEQFRTMVLSLNDNVPAGTIALFFRTAYERGDGHVTFDSFMLTAEAFAFFTTCMRLPSPNVLANHHLSEPSDHDGGINAPHAKLGSLVAKHFTLYETDCKLSLHAAPPMAQALAKHAIEDLRVVLMEGRGSSIDGFRALAAYQRLLAIQLQDRIVRSEAASSVLPSTTLYRLDKGLYSAIDCVRIDHTKRSGGELLLDSIRRKISVYRMQRAFRARLLRDQGVPLNMRQLMHGGYGNGKSNYRDRRAIRPTKWLLAVISDLVQSKFVADMATSGTGAFVEHIYDHMTQQFGSRWEAEKTIHDIFVNTRSLVSTHPRILLFSQLCGMGASGEDKYYGSLEAFAFIRMVLHCGHHSFPILQHTSSEKADFCRHEDAVAIIELFFESSGADNKERIFGRLRELERLSSRPKAADADLFLLFLLEEWRRYILERMNQIKVTCCSDTDLMSVDGYLSLDNLEGIFRRTRVDMSELQVAQVFRQVVQSNYSRLSLLDRIVKSVFPILNQEIACMEDLEDVAPTHYKTRMYLLLSYWEPYEETSKIILDQLRAIAAKNEVDAAMATVDMEKRRNSFNRGAKARACTIMVADVSRLEDRFNDLCEKMLLLVNHLATEDKNDPEISGKDHDEDVAHHESWTHQVDTTSILFRRYLTECTRLRALANIEIGPIPDKWQGIAAG